jgi:hypothetical protein
MYYVVGSSANRAGALLVVTFLLVQYAVFFWSCSHLAKAKGYSNAVILPGILGPLVQLIIYAIVLFALRDKFPDKFSRTQKPAPAVRKSRHRHESSIARIVRYRRNALVANSLGIAGIVLTLFIILVPTGLFADHRDDYLLALAIFVPAYVSVIYGCWWWVKAKGWHEAVVFIGLIPLAVLGIRYVRLIYIAVPLLLPATMAFMPIILIGVVAALPDKSGMPRRNRRHHDS